MRVSIDDQMLVSAVRYALGRHTYVVKWTVDEVIWIWPKLSFTVQQTILRDVQQHLSDQKNKKPSGMDLIDNTEWQRLLAFINTQPKETLTP